LEGNEADNLVILSLKKSQNEVASEAWDEVLGNMLGLERDSRELRADQSFFGCLAELDISDLKKVRRDDVMSLATRRD
jgi:hypothetical protein